MGKVTSMLSDMTWQASFYRLLKSHQPSYSEHMLALLCVCPCDVYSVSCSARLVIVADKNS